MIDKHANLRMTLTVAIALSAFVPLILRDSSPAGPDTPSVSGMNTALMATMQAPFAVPPRIPDRAAQE